MFRRVIVSTLRSSPVTGGVRNARNLRPACVPVRIAGACPRANADAPPRSAAPPATALAPCRNTSRRDIESSLLMTFLQQ
jgi:hypothetical protein